MLIDAGRLDERKKEFSFEEDISFSRSGINVPCKVSITVSACKSGNEYIAEGRGKAVLDLSCDLCLTHFEYPMDFDFRESYSDTVDEDGEIWKITGKDIDLKPAVIANIMLSLPMQVLCSEQCKGLCPKCGHNLNEGDCGCDRGYINPQFEGLLNMFDD